MDYGLVFTINGLGLLSLVFMLIFIKTNLVSSPRWNKTFTGAVICNICLIIVDVCQYFVGTFNFSHKEQINVMIIMLCYGMNPLLPMYLSPLFCNNKKLKLTSYILSALNALLCFVSAIVMMALELSSDFPLAKVCNYFMMAVSVFNMIVFFVYAFIWILNERIEGGELATIILIFASILAAFVIEALSELRFILWNCSAICLTIFYLFIQSQLLKTDPLTRLINRSIFEKDLDKYANELEVGVIVFDINNLKYVNDTFGHKVGDNLICLISSSIRKCFTKGRCYRIGGDEFVYIGIKDNVENIDKSLLKFKQICPEYYVSYGTSFSGISKTLLKTFNEADNKMYFAKAQVKQIKTNPSMIYTADLNLRDYESIS